jgi:hypothetical protein
MGQLWIISVTGAVPHSACHFAYTGPNYQDSWLGFTPSVHRKPYSSHGKVDTDSEAHRINHAIIFEVVDTVMAEATKRVTQKYSSGPYILGVRDCVSLSADVARQCGLGVPAINMTPYGLIEILAFWNNYENKW